jgi:histidinol-phosphate aminotransferase
MTYEYERVTTPGQGLRLHLNENTAGCSPRVVAALQGVTREQAAFYPDYEEAIAACAAHFGVTSSEVLLTNGLDEGILAASISALRGRSAGGSPEAIVVTPAFDMYAACADVAGGRVVEVPAGPNLEFPVDRVLAAIGPETRLIFVTNPGNPSGLVVRREAILDIAAAAPQALVFVDEAYADFSGTTLIGAPELNALTHLVIGRTFAKAHGLAAIRVGAVVGHEGTLDRIRRAVPPYSVNVFAAVALRTALSDREYYDWYLEQVAVSKAVLTEALDRLGVKYWPSAANFVLAGFGARATGIARGLADRGVHVRDRSRDPGCRGCLRITTGVVDHTRLCISALEEILCAAQ